MLKPATLEIGGKDYTAEVAMIERTSLGIEDHGLFIAMLHVDYGNGGHQGIGGHILDDVPEKREPGSDRQGTAFGMEYLMRIMRTVGVREWEDLKGKRLYILKLVTAPGNWGSEGIANINDPEHCYLLFDDLRKEFFGE